MDWTGEKFIDQFVDPGMDIDINWSPKYEIERQITRLSRDVALMELVRDHPGRIPESAGRERRKADKKYARQARARAATWLREWYVIRDGRDKLLESDMEKRIQEAKQDDELKMQAAQLRWATWWQEYRVTLTATMRRVATQAKHAGFSQRSLKKQGNQMLNKLSNEWRVYDDVFGNLPTQELE
jgi:hypothetical protein